MPDGTAFVHRCGRYLYAVDPCIFCCPFSGVRKYSLHFSGYSFFDGGNVRFDVMDAVQESVFPGCGHKLLSAAGSGCGMAGTKLQRGVFCAMDVELDRHFGGLYCASGNAVPEDYFAKRYGKTVGGLKAARWLQAAKLRGRKEENLWN